MEPDVIIIGGGPAGLIAAEMIARAGKRVTVYERKPSLGRKFLMAGRGGLNITHSEDIEKFLARYGDREDFLAPMIRRFPPAALQEWVEGLGEGTFVGSSGRVFPVSMKASPLLRAWIARLEFLGVQFKMSRTWAGWDNEYLLFTAPDGSTEKIKAAATLLALGGASWPGLGSDGNWVSLLEARGVKIAPLMPANCGFAVLWSAHFRENFSGQPLKAVTLSFHEKAVPGEMMVTEGGIEGGAVYALSSDIRKEIASSGSAEIRIDLRPSFGIRDLATKLDKPRGRQSFSTYLKKNLNLSSVMIALLREVVPDVQNLDSYELASLIKDVPLQALSAFPITRAISTAGGIMPEALDEHSMIKNLPGVFSAGEMLDWEAPTGGYLLQASFATGVHAAEGILKFL